MSDQQPPPEHPSGQPTPPENPYGQPAGSPTPYGQPAGSPNPYGQPAPPQNPYGQPAAPQDPHGRPIESQDPYGQGQAGHADEAGQAGHSWQAPTGYPYPPARHGDARPATVTAAGWITIVLSGLSALLYAFIALMFFVARDQVVNELERQPEFRDLDVDLDSIVGALVAVMLVLTVWSLVAVVLGVFVLRRSNVARILLVISSAVVALGALLSILSGISAVWLVATLLVIVLLFVGGAGDWFARRGTPDPYAPASHDNPPPAY
ncbi:hypothetical protein EXE58_09935 [Nocardioides seonyuensis]|uniref:DUF4064 domain-containing protein n=1 Tax=Nocardioides seonyuensis TaxID=2518371 RepID=A0A4V1BMB0_9ACTN|nr:hypothetical protein [Nocardioides seonyuensis]QBX55742.1 hypothetical protein EXE58_09935 [Nocardioides seonyuensis]